MNMKKLALIAFSLFVLPAITFAADAGFVTRLQPVRDLVKSIGDIVAMLIPILIAAALVMFFVGLIQYVLKAGGKGGKQGRNYMMWGLVALFVMISVYGIIRLAQSALGISPSDTTNIKIPKFPGQ